MVFMSAEKVLAWKNLQKMALVLTTPRLARAVQSKLSSLTWDESYGSHLCCEGGLIMESLGIVVVSSMGAMLSVWTGRILSVWWHP